MLYEIIQCKKYISSEHVFTMTNLLVVFAAKSFVVSKLQQKFSNSLLAVLLLKDL